MLVCLPHTRLLTYMLTLAFCPLLEFWADACFSGHAESAVRQCPTRSLVQPDDIGVDAVADGDIG
ncbi:hypothetical protein D3C76_442750 [compost metagenome]